ncbi:MAG: GlxA family transcriptional regulator [Pseudomonadota bacterium]
MARFVGSLSWRQVGGIATILAVMKQRSVQFFIAEGFQPLDLAGPVSVFSTANELRGSSYALSTISLTASPVRPSAGPAVLPDDSIYKVDPPDTFVIVGGEGMRTLRPSRTIAARLRELAGGARRVVSICTGAFLAGRLGLIDGKRVTTHWRHQDELRTEFPTCLLQDDRLYSQDGRFWSSAGVTAGIDACLALVSRDHGSGIAANVARQLVVYLHRPGGQAQYSEVMRAQVTSDRFASLVYWIRSNLKANLSIPELAARAGMSERNFQRRFKQDFGQPASSFVEQMRVAHAREILKAPGASVARTASSVGFRNPDSFRRAFERVLGVSPSFYKQRFEGID